MNQPKPLTRQCPHCGASADNVTYHSRYSTRDGIRTVFRCRLCRKTFCDRYGTAFYDLKTPEQKVLHSVHQVMEGLGYEAVARLEAVHPTSVHRWVARAHQQAALADQQIVQRVETEVIEMDELYSFAGTKQAVPEAPEAPTGKHWTHCTMARDSRLLIDVEVGPRTTETAKILVKATAGRLAPGSWPLWCSDGWEPYVEALLSAFYVLIHHLRTGRRGRPRAPQPIADPGLRYGQIVKHHAARRLVAVTKRVIFGVEELVPLTLISTSLLERLNGTLRLHVSPMRRKTRAFAKCRETLNLHVQLFKSYYNLCLRHGSLEGKTPAQAAGLSDHQWSVRELLTFGASGFSKIT
jgi:transposase-like protein/IS1 family transposase